MKGEATMEKVHVEQEDVHPIKQTIMGSIEVHEKQSQQQVPTTIKLIKYMTTPIVFQSILFGTTTTIKTISQDEKDNGHTKTTVDVQQQFH